MPYGFWGNFNNRGLVEQIDYFSMQKKYIIKGDVVR